MMANVDGNGELEEIVRLLETANCEGERSDAYGRLLHVEQCSGKDPQAIQFLCEHLGSLLNYILPDISSQHEEIAAQALKSLGFIVFHPTLVAALSDENVHAVLQSLVEVITNTKMKAICNLAMWCISVQQFEGHLMSSHIHSIIRATVHALDNPMGSVSTTFEAFQAVVKLVDQMSNTMRDLSHIWCPPVYRRLISTDKRERDMAERCLRKIMLTFSSPLPLLSKIVAADIKQNLLLNMEKLLHNNGCKVYVIQAWGWFIRLLGENVIKSRSLVNQMLKIPQQMFADPDTQVRIATQVAWESLIDAFIQYPVQALVDQTPTKKNSSPETVLLTASGTNHQLQNHSPVKHLKLLMMPLVEVMSSKCDVSVRMSCWKTWNYLLHKLDSSVNNPAVVSIVLDPIFKVIFETGPDNKNLWIWDLCLNLLEEFVSVKAKHNELNILVHREPISPKTPSHGISLKTNKDNFLYLPIKWLPWNLNQIELLLNYVGILWKCGFRGNQCSDFSSLTLNGALRIFRLILKGVQSDLNEELKPLEEHVQVIHFILHFVQSLCQDIALKTFSECTKGPNLIIFNLLEVMKDELRPSMLASLSFKMPLDLNEIWKIKGGRFSESLGHKENIQTLGISLAKIDMVAPVVYLMLLWLNLVVHLCSDELEEEKLLERMGKITQIVSSGVDSLENFQVLASVLYAVGQHVNFYGKIEIDHVNEGKDSESLPFKIGSFFWLRVWKVFAKHLREHIEFVKDVTLFEVGTIEAGYQLIYSFLLFPMHFRVLYSFVNSNEGSSDHKYYKEYCNLNLEKEFDLIIQEWVFLYDSANLISSLKSAWMNFFAEGLCKKVLRVIDEEHDGHTSKEAPKDCDSGKLSFFRKSDYYLRLVGGLAAHVLKQVDTTALGSLIINSSGEKGASNPSNVKSILTFVARFLEQAIDADWNCVMVSRVFNVMACFLIHISTQDDILLFMQKLSGPLSKWLCACSTVERISEEGSPVFQLEKVWNQLLNCLHKSRPPIIFDSKFLSLQEPLLVPAFEHIHSPIANRTIAFWEATYGKTSLLSYPESLLPVLSSLSQKVKITLPGFNISCSPQCPNGNVLEPANELSPNISEKIDINRTCSGFANWGTANYQSGLNKVTSVGPSFNVLVGSQNIKSCQRIQHSYSTETGEVPSSSLQGVINSRERENNVMNQNVNLSKGRKKLKFMDDSQDIDYVSIPSSVERKLHPLTDHQREVKRAQRGRGMDTMGHGPGIKTYTAADFSQGNGDSEEPEELNLTEIILDKCRKKN